MKEQLIRYVDLLFAGAPDCGDIKQEILQNSLDRYDDLIGQGKSPEAAYSLTISGIGDVSEILKNAAPQQVLQPIKPAPQEAPAWKKVMRAAAVFLYIISAIPLFVLSELGMDVLGLCGTIAIAGVATALIIIASGGHTKKQKEEKPESRETPLQSAVNSIIWTVGLVAYFVISFSTGAWYITWVIFPMIGAAQALVRAIMDLKEAGKHEN